eukprot:scaffold281_cov73-Alexandrium_tamarense.AAC.2
MWCIFFLVSLYTSLRAMFDTCNPSHAQVIRELSLLFSLCRAAEYGTRRRRENEQEREENLNFLKLNVKLRLRYCLLPCHVEGYKFLHLRSRFMVPVHFIGNCHLGNYSKHFHPATLQRRNHG